MIQWIKPCESAHCIEVAEYGTDRLIRNSTDPLGPVLRVTTEEWENFTDAVKAGTFD